MCVFLYLRAQLVSPVLLGELAHQVHLWVFDSVNSQWKCSAFICCFLFGEYLTLRWGKRAQRKCFCLFVIGSCWTSWAYWPSWKRRTTRLTGRSRTSRTSGWERSCWPSWQPRRQRRWWRGWTHGKYPINSTHKNDKRRVMQTEPVMVKDTL